MDHFLPEAIEIKGHSSQGPPLDSNFFEELTIPTPCYHLNGVFTEDKEQFHHLEQSEVDELLRADESDVDEDNNMENRTHPRDGHGMCTPFDSMEHGAGRMAGPSLSLTRHNLIGARPLLFLQRTRKADMMR